MKNSFFYNKKNIMIVEVYKKIGETPNELIENFKKERGITEKVAFAGRLDPMSFW